MGKQLPWASHSGPLPFVDLFHDLFLVPRMSGPNNLRIRPQETGEHLQVLGPFVTFYLLSRPPHYSAGLDPLARTRVILPRSYLLSFSSNLLPDPVTVAPKLSLCK